MSTIPEKRQAVVGDASGYMKCAAARHAFWAKLEEQHPALIAELLDVRPALVAMASWPEQPSDDDSNRRAILAEAITLMRLGPPEFAIPELLRIRKIIGPLYRWPLRHVESWFDRYNLDSLALKTDALQTMATNLWLDFTDGWRARAPRALLDPPEIPKSVLVYDIEARSAAMSLGLRPVHIVNYPRSLFLSEEIDELAGLKQESLELRADALDRLRRRAYEIVNGALKRLDTEGTTRYLPPNENHLDWFIRHQMFGEDEDDIALDYEGHNDETLEKRTVERGIQGIATLVGLPPRGRGRPSK